MYTFYTIKKVTGFEENMLTFSENGGNDNYLRPQTCQTNHKYDANHIDENDCLTHDSKGHSYPLERTF